MVPRSPGRSPLPLRTRDEPSGQPLSEAPGCALHLPGDGCRGAGAEVARDSGAATAGDLPGHAASRPPPGAGRIALALAFGLICHTVFAAAVLAMIAAMFFGLSESLGRVPWPWAALANAALIAQFPLLHSLLLTGRGRALAGPARARPTRRRRSPPPPMRSSPRSSLLALFALWTPSGSSGGGPRARRSGRSRPPMRQAGSAAQGQLRRRRRGAVGRARMDVAAGAHPPRVPGHADATGCSASSASRSTWPSR
jgi:hypothetical protein